MPDDEAYDNANLASGNANFASGATSDPNSAFNNEMVKCRIGGGIATMRRKECIDGGGEVVIDIPTV